MRILMFMLFFSVGAIALALAALGPELLNYYENHRYVMEARSAIGGLENLNARYGTLLTRLAEDPNLVRRVAPVTIGAEVNEPDTVYPRARAQELAAARQALAEETRRTTAAGPPAWLQRCIDPQRRKGLFGAGSALVLIAFVCFGHRNDTPAVVPAPARK